MLIDHWGFDVTWPTSLAEFIDRASAILFGTVVGIDDGFLEDQHAGLMLEITVEEVAKPHTAYDTATVFVFYPAGEVRIGPHRICRLNDELPDPPEIGDRVILAPRRPPIDPDYSVISLLMTGVEILFSRASRTMIPQGLDDVPEFRQAPDFKALIQQTRALTGRPVRR